MNKEYCCLAEKRIEMADKEKSIQGYFDGVFWDRNSLNLQKKEQEKGCNNKKKNFNDQRLF